MCLSGHIWQLLLLSSQNYVTNNNSSCVSALVDPNGFVQNKFTPICDKELLVSNLWSKWMVLLNNLACFGGQKFV